MGKIYRIDPRRSMPGVLALCGVIVVIVLSGLVSRVDLATPIVAPAQAAASTAAPPAVEYFPAHFTVHAAPAEPVDTF